MSEMRVFEKKKAPSIHKHALDFSPSGDVPASDSDSGQSESNVRDVGERGVLRSLEAARS